MSVSPEAAGRDCRTRLPAWQRLQQSLSVWRTRHLREVWADEGEARAAAFTRRWDGLLLDFSKQRLDQAVLNDLLTLARECGLEKAVGHLLRGDTVNQSEGRPALHTALRLPRTASLPVDGEDVVPAVHASIDRMRHVVQRIHARQWRGVTGEAITDVVNIGIGGSDLGPRMAIEALAHLAAPAVPGVRVHCVSNPDAWALWSVLRGLDAARTLVVVSSKTFTTQETLTNAASARQWLADQGVPADAIAQHLVAITASPAKAADMGYPPDRTFLFWDWVGGRYSVWSSLGLPLAIAIGKEHFRLFLAGARAMDEHFCTAPLAQNLPVQLALNGLWNRNFLNLPTHLIVPYASRLVRFTPFVQQMDMESNGKRTHSDGTPVDVDTGPIVWGGLGIDGQHAYFQLIHQGRHTVPVDFIGVQNEDTPLPLAATHHAVVNLNLRAQAEAMARGRTLADTQALLQQDGLNATEAKAMAPHRSFEGNIPSHLLWLDRLDPARLGALIALYEHKVFTQAAIWGINAYDQWGVELGKTMAKAMEKAGE